LAGYDTATMAGDVHRPRVRQLVFQETLLPGLPAGPGLPGGEHDPSLAADDVRTGWHFSFFSLSHVPELLLAGRERPFWTWDPSALTEEDIDDMVHSAESSPRPVTTSRGRTRPPWPRPTSTSSQPTKR